MRIIKIILVIMVVYISYTGFSIRTYQHINEQHPTDAAVVLGAAAWEDKPSPVLKERINHALALYDKRIVKNIIFTGGKDSEVKWAESEVAKRYAIQKGIPKEHIFIETKSQITEQNLKEAIKVGNKRGFESYTLVSDPLHMKRAMTMAEDFGMDAYASPTQTSVYKSLKTKIPFFLRELFFYIGYQVTQWIPRT